MKKKSIFILLTIVMCSFGASYAQNSQFHLGVGFPSGHFGEDDKKSDKSGYAATGFNLGYKHYTPLNTPGFPNLSFVFSMDLFYNDLQSDRKDYWEDNNKNVDFSFSKYINAPVMGGLSYTVPLNEIVGIYGEVGLGANISWLTPQKVEWSNTEVKTTYTVAFNFAYAFEGGILIRNKYTIGLRYNNLGTYKYKYKQVTESGSNKDTVKGKDVKQPVSLLALTAGIKF